jgi:predicted nucleic acid-binding protein
VSFLVDSDWLIDAYGGLPDAVDALARLSAEGLAVSIVAVCEVYEGAFGLASPENELRSLREFLGDYQTLPLTNAIAERFARLRALLRRQGQLIPDMDLLIAATALHHDLTLVTRNTRHFDRIAGLSIFQ